MLAASPSADRSAIVGAASTGEDNPGGRIRHRVLRSLAAARVDVDRACADAGVRAAALSGSSTLLFVEVVALAQLVGCSPASFF
jgi:hypothetical protein